MTRLFFALVLAPLVLNTTAWAHPVSYEGGTAVFFHYHSERTDFYTNYSLARNYAVELRYHSIEDDQKDRTQYMFPKFNWLIKRWNLPAAQANLYLSGGPGLSYRDDKTGVAGIAEFQADYETRRFYTLFKAESIQAENDDDFNRLRYRIGWSPYEAEYDELQTFLIAQVSYEPDMEQHWPAGPVLRMFYKDIFVELGATYEGDVMGSVMYHF